MSQTLERLKLVHCTWASGVGAGVGRMDSYYYRFLDRSLFDVSLISLRESEETAPPYDRGIPYTYLHSGNRFSSLLQVFSTADIVQFQGSFDPLVCEAAKIAEVPVLIEILHNSEPGGIFPQIDAILCVSESVKALQNEQQKSISILNGIDLNEFPYLPKYHPNDSIVLLQVSRREKGAPNLDEIANDVLALDPRIKIWLAGPGQDLPSSERVRFLGTRSDIATIYQQADLMVLMTRHEPFGLAAIEAMASGCLPLVADEGGFREIVTHGHDGWLSPPADPVSLIECLQSALQRYGSSAWRDIQLQARRTVETRFDIRTKIKEYEAVYRSVVERKGRRRTLGPVNIPATSNALVGDALFSYLDKNWSRTGETLNLLLAAGELPQHPECLRTLKLLTQAAESDGQHELCSKLCAWLSANSPSDCDIIRTWIEVDSDSRNMEIIRPHCIRLIEVAPDLVLLLVEKYLPLQNVQAAVSLLAEAAQATSNRANKEVFEKWLARLSS